MMSRSRASRTGGRATALAAVTFLGLALLPAGSSAADTSATGEVRDLVFTVRDLSFATEDVDGRTAETQTGNRVNVRLAADVFFAFDSARLASKVEAELDELATRLQEQASGTVTITGHTDSKGSDGYNLRLSRRRADAVREELASRLGDSGLELVHDGKGEAEPIARNANPDGSDNPEGRARNRRVEVRFELG